VAHSIWYTYCKTSKHQRKECYNKAASTSDVIQSSHYENIPKQNIL
jgi:hypothetical protein